MVNEIPHRPDPDQLLEQLEAEERQRRRGKLKVFLGYASGVGKSIQMLDEGRRRRERGEDVVVGATQAKSSTEAEKLLSHLEVIPPLVIAGQNAIDVPAILHRRPQVVLVDGLAYDNPPGSRHPRRYQDLEELVAAGISVITSVNLQYIAEFQDEIENLTGKRALQSVPRSFVETADEIVVIDTPAEESLRMAMPSMSGTDMQAQQQKLSRLREMALLLTAEIVDRQLEDYLRTHNISEAWGTQERILVCLTPRSSASLMIQSGRRNAERFRGEFLAIYVNQPNLSKDDQKVLDNNLQLARQEGAQVAVLDSSKPIEAILSFARDNGVTQIFIGHSLQHGIWQSFRRTAVERLIEAAHGIDVRIFPH
jgi:two-component system, OmpR family, sensor histidine kinase KdpD